jgi:hypothetical protein
MLPCRAPCAALALVGGPDERIADAQHLRAVGAAGDFGVTLCGALIALPWWLRTEPDAGSGTHEAQLACD